MIFELIILGIFFGLALAVGLYLFATTMIEYGKKLQKKGGE